MKDGFKLRTAGSVLWLAVKLSVALLALLSLAVSPVLYQGF